METKSQFHSLISFTHMWDWQKLDWKNNYALRLISLPKGPEKPCPSRGHFMNTPEMEMNALLPKQKLTMLGILIQTWWLLIKWISKWNYFCQGCQRSQLAVSVWVYHRDLLVSERQQKTPCRPPAVRSHLCSMTIHLVTIYWSSMIYVMWEAYDIKTQDPCHGWIRKQLITSGCILQACWVKSSKSCRQWLLMFIEHWSLTLHWAFKLCSLIIFTWRKSLLPEGTKS